MGAHYAAIVAELGNLDQGSPVGGFSESPHTKVKAHRESRGAFTAARTKHDICRYGSWNDEGR